MLTILITNEHKLLVIMYLIAYPVAMIIQVRDPKLIVDVIDWILTFFSNLLGAIIIYMMVHKWENIGFRLALVVFGSLFTYRTLIFILSMESQNTISRTFIGGLVRMLNNITKGHKDEDTK